VVEPQITAPKFTDEQIGFTSDGKYVWFASHDEDERAFLRLYDLDLHQVDEAPGPEDGWSESWLAVAEHAPDWIVGGTNIGDDAGAQVAYRASGGKLISKCDEFDASIKAYTDERIGSLTVTPRSEIVICDCDGLFGVTAFPPSGDRTRLEHVNVTTPYRAANGDFEQGQVEGRVMATKDHLIIGVESPKLLRTVDLIIVDHDLAPIAMIDLPFEADPVFLANGRFASAENGKTTIWELRR